MFHYEREGGLGLKISEAMALKRAVVSTSIGCEGLDVINGQHLFIADNPKDFADKVYQLMTNPDLYKTVTDCARMLVEVDYDWDDISKKLLEVYEEISCETR